MRLTRSCSLLIALTLLSTSVGIAQRTSPRRLSTADVDDVATLVMLEDMRQFDEAALTRIAASANPEVRRRAVISIGRITTGGDRGRAMLVLARADRDPIVVAAVAFSTGQLKDAAAVPWLGEELMAAATPVATAREAACALGKIRTPEAHAVLARYLSDSPLTSAADVVGEALLSTGRFTTHDDLAPILRWTTSKNVEIRWRAAWALFRPKNPDAIEPLLRLSSDSSGDVRFWAVRGLVAAVVDQAHADRARVSARLRDALHDADRRVRTEAIRALVGYDDDASFASVMTSLDSTDTWISVSAAEGLGRFKSRAAIVVPRLVEAAGPMKPTALRVTALAALVQLAPDKAIDAAAALTPNASLVARTAAFQALQRQLGDAGRAKYDEIAKEPAMKDLLPPPAGGRARTTVANEQGFEALAADYRPLVTKWIVPDDNGAPRPHVVFDTPRGEIEIELYPGDAPLATDNLLKMIASGQIVGTEFGRVVPNFVAQQRTIAGASLLRDEVNQHGLLRGTLSWASSGLDTGRPGYTLGSTPQPHNEGDFTALGHVVRGMDVVDRLELGDRILAAKIRQ